MDVMLSFCTLFPLGDLCFQLRYVFLLELKCCYHQFILLQF